MGRLGELLTRAFGLKTVSESNLFLMGEPASSGERVSEDGALGIVPVYRAVTMISNDIGRLPVFAATVDTDGDLLEVESVVADLLGREPNRYMGGFEFRRTLTSQALRYGNAFASIVRNGRGEVMELVPLLPGDVSMHTSPQSGVYYTHSVIGQIEPEDILHI